MVLATALVALAALSAEARPLKVVIDGKALPDLRGSVSFSQLAADAPAPGPAPAMAPAEAETGLCGCPLVPEDTCTCGASLSYLQCVHTKCAAGECECPKDSFESECSALSQSCSSELDISGCHSLHTSCEGKYHQSADGTVGITLDTAGLTDDAYCGPHGRCTGDIKVTVNIYRPVEGAWMECVIPTGKKNHLFHCRNEVTDAGASDCSLPMPKQIAPDDAVRGHCYLTEGKKGKKITRDAWFVVRNRYGADAAEEAAASAPKAVKAPKKNVVLERADESDEAEKEAEIKEEEVEAEIEEEGVEKSDEADEDADEEETKDTEEKSSKDGEHWFKKHKATKVKEGVGAKTQAPKTSLRQNWVPLVIIMILVIALVGLILNKRRSQSA